MSTIMFILFFLFGTLAFALSLAFIVIQHTNYSIKERMRPIVTFVHDYDAMVQSWEEAGGYWVEGEEGDGYIVRVQYEQFFPTPEKLDIETIDYILRDTRVDSYHVASTLKFETYFLEYLPEGAEGTTFSTGFVNERTNQRFANLERRNINIITLQGDSKNEPLKFRGGLIEVSRGFSLAEADSHQVYSLVFPLLMSENFATLNGFGLGSTVSLTYNIFDTEGDWIMLDNPTWDDVIDMTMTFKFYVAGLFKVIADEIEHVYPPWIELNRQRTLENMFFTSHNAIIHIVNMKSENTIVDFSPDIYLLLNCPTELSYFKKNVMEALPNYWMVNYVSGGYGNIAYALDNINQIIDFIILVATMGSLLVLALIFLFVLGRRKQELGIYLVLGEKKSNIHLQVVIEMLLIAILSLFVSFAPGSLISQHVTRQLIRTELEFEMQHFNEYESLYFGANHLETLGLGRPLERDFLIREIGESPSLSSIVLSLVIIISIVIIALNVTMVLYLKQSPKKLLE